MEMIEQLKQNKKMIFLLSIPIMILLVLSGIFLLGFRNQNDEKEVLDDLAYSEATTVSTTEGSEQDPAIYIDVKGAVKEPGLYKIKNNLRVWDVLQLAGGTTEKANTKQVNFSMKLEDQMVIYVPEIGETVDSNTFSASVGTEEPAEKINLNRATLQDLQSLPGIGEKKAQEIIRYREEQGAFKTIDELKNISGIGEKTIEKLKDSIFV